MTLMKCAEDAETELRAKSSKHCEMQTQNYSKKSVQMLVKYNKIYKYKS